MDDAFLKPKSRSSAGDEHMKVRPLKIGDLSRRTGCNIETIRYYERIGLVPAPPRLGRYRSYGSSDVQRLRFIRRARALGFTLDEIRTLLSLAPDAAENCAQAQDVAQAHLVDVRSKIAALRSMERVLAEAVDACASGERSGCPIIETLSD